FPGAEGIGGGLGATSHWIPHCQNWPACRRRQAAGGRRRPFPQRAQRLITTTSSATVDLKSHAVNPLVLHAFGTAPQGTYPVGAYAARTLGYKRITVVAEDFTYGHEGAGGFQLAFEAAGGKIVQKLWPPLNALEYGSYLAQIKRRRSGLPAVGRRMPRPSLRRCAMSD